MNFGNSSQKDNGDKVDSSKGTEENRESTFMKPPLGSPTRTEVN